LFKNIYRSEYTIVVDAKCFNSKIKGKTFHYSLEVNNIVALTSLNSSILFYCEANHTVVLYDVCLNILVFCRLTGRRGGSDLEKKKVPPPYVATSSTAPKTSSAPIYKPATNVKNPEKSGVPKGIVNPNPDPSREPLLQEPASGVHPMGRNSPGFGDLGVKQITGSVPTLDESFNSNTNRSFDNDRARPEATVRNSSGSTGSGRNASAV